MSRISDTFDRMNSVVRDTFSDDGAMCVYTPDQSLFSGSFNIKTIPLDPIRSEGPAPSNFTIRWAARADFIAAGYMPGNGKKDTITVEDGTVYRVEQVQGDSGAGVRLICKQKGNT